MQKQPVLGCHALSPSVRVIRSAVKTRGWAEGQVCCPWSSHRGFACGADTWMGPDGLLTGEGLRGVGPELSPGRQAGVCSVQ